MRRELVEQERPVGQPGERVVQRLVGQLGLGALERGDVGGHGQHVVDPTVLAELGHGPGLEPLGLAVATTTSHSVSSRWPVSNTWRMARSHRGVVGHAEDVGGLGDDRADVHLVGRAGEHDGLA